MKRFLALAALFFIAAAGWRIGGALSTDAIGLALGVLFGMMAGIPAALLAISVDRQRTGNVREIPHATSSVAYPQHPPPVIIMAGSPHSFPQQNSAFLQSNEYGYPQLQGTRQAGYPTSYPASSPASSPAMMPPPRSARQFRMVGEQEQAIEQW